MISFCQHFSPTSPVFNFYTNTSQRCSAFHRAVQYPLLKEWILHMQRARCIHVSYSSFLYHTSAQTQLIRGFPWLSDVNTQIITQTRPCLLPQHPYRLCLPHVQGGSNMTGTELYVNKPHCAAAVRPWESEATTSTLPPARVRTYSVLSGSC